jgi:hypothetical protein
VDEQAETQIAKSLDPFGAIGGEGGNRKAKRERASERGGEKAEGWHSFHGSALLRWVSW